MIIESKEELNFDSQEHCPSWMCDGPWYNTKIFSQYHGSIFEQLFRTICKDMYDIMCDTNAYNNMHVTEPDGTSSGGDTPLLNNSTTDAIASIGLALKLIYNWNQ